MDLKENDGDMKATIVEAFIGQLKLMIARVVNMLNDSDVSTYLTFLDTIMECYNESPHSGLGGSRTPFDVYHKGIVVPKTFLYKSFFTQKILRRGHIPVSLMNGLFKKRSTCQWSKEVFMVCKTYITDPVTYVVEDLQGEELKEV